MCSILQKTSEAQNKRPDLTGYTYIVEIERKERGREGWREGRKGGMEGREGEKEINLAEP